MNRRCRVDAVQRSILSRAVDYPICRDSSAHGIGRERHEAEQHTFVHFCGLSKQGMVTVSAFPAATACMAGGLRRNPMPARRQWPTCRSASEAVDQSVIDRPAAARKNHAYGIADIQRRDQVRHAGLRRQRAAATPVLAVDQNLAVLRIHVGIAGGEDPDTASDAAGGPVDGAPVVQRLDIAVVAFAERVAADVVKVFSQLAGNADQALMSASLVR